MGPPLPSLCSPPLASACTGKPCTGPLARRTAAPPHPPQAVTGAATGAGRRCRDAFFRSEDGSADSPEGEACSRVVFVFVAALVLPLRPQCGAARSELTEGHTWSAMHTRVPPPPCPGLGGCGGACVVSPWTDGAPAWCSEEVGARCCFDDRAAFTGTGNNASGRRSRTGEPLTTLTGEGHPSAPAQRRVSPGRRRRSSAPRPSIFGEG